MKIPTQNIWRKWFSGVIAADVTELRNRSDNNIINDTQNEFFFWFGLHEKNSIDRTAAQVNTLYVIRAQFSWTMWAQKLASSAHIYKIYVLHRIEEKT